MTFEDNEMKKSEESEEEETVDQLTQLIHVFTQGALMDVQGDQSDDKVQLYLNVMNKYSSVRLAVQ